MKRFFTFAMTLVFLLASLCACSNAQSAETPSQEEAPAVETPVDSAEDALVELPQHEAFATTPEEFTQKLQGLIDLSKYDVYQDEDFPDYISYDLDHEYDYGFNYDYSVSFADGSSITLPITFKDMENTTWTTEATADYQVSNRIQTLIPYVNSNGQEITLWTTNLAAIDNDDDVRCNLSECTFYELEIDICTEESEKNSDGEYIDYFQRNPKAPNFTVYGSVNADCSIADVINAIGAPSIIDFQGETNEIKLTYYQEENDWISSLRFTFAADGDYMVSMSYEYAI